MKGICSAVPGASYGLLDVAKEVVVLVALNGTKVLRIAVGDDAASQAEAGVAGVFGEFRNRQVIGDARSDGKPVLVSGGDGEEVGIIDLLDEVAGFFHESPHECEALEVQRSEVVEIDGSGDTAHDEILDVGILAAKDGHGLSGLALVIEGFEIVGHGHEVDLWRKLHGRVPPIAGGEDAQPAAVNE